MDATSHAAAPLGCRRKKWRPTLLGALFAAAGSPLAPATDYYWVNTYDFGGGPFAGSTVFGDPLQWSVCPPATCPGLPGASDRALFTVFASFGNVNFFADATNDEAVVALPTNFNLSSNTYYLSSSDAAAPGLQVGNGSFGAGILGIASGTVDAGAVGLAMDAGSYGQVDILSGGRLESAATYIGRSGTGVFNAHAGVVFSQHNYLGYNSSASGTLNLSAAFNAHDGIANILPASFHVGYSGSGTVNVTGSGELATGFLASIGTNASSTGVVNVTGPNARWDHTYTQPGIEAVEFVIGEHGVGTLNVQSGGQVRNNFADGMGRIQPVDTFIARQVGASGTLAVDANAASLFAGSGSLYVGGSAAGAGGSALVTIAGGTVDIADTVRIWGQGKVAHTAGRLDADRLVIEDHAGPRFGASFFSDPLDVGDTNLETVNAAIGGSSSADRVTFRTSATVSGYNGFWDNAGTLTVGDSAAGRLDLVDGGHLRTNELILGKLAGVTGTVELSGASNPVPLVGLAPDAVVYADVIKVGNAGIGVFNLQEPAGDTGQNGVRARETYIGYGAGSQGTVSITTIGASGSVAIPVFDVTEKLVIGHDGSGELNVSGESDTSFARVRSQAVEIGANAGSHGTLNLDGGGASLSVNVQFGGASTSPNSITIGGDGHGTVNLRNGAELYASNATVGADGLLENRNLAGDTGGRAALSSLTVNGGTVRTDVVNIGGIGTPGLLSTSMIVVNGNDALIAAGTDFLAPFTLTVNDGLVSAGGSFSMQSYFGSPTTATNTGGGAIVAATATIEGSVVDNAEVLVGWTDPAAGIPFNGSFNVGSSLTVTGAAARVTGTVNLAVGLTGDGTVALTDGAVVEAQDTRLGSGPAGNATVSLDNGAQLVGSGIMYIGETGADTSLVTVAGGSELRNDSATSQTLVGGFDPDGSGAVAVTGATSAFSTAGALDIGTHGGQGTVTLDGGTLTAGQTLTVGPNGLLVNGGTVTAPLIDIAGGTLAGAGTFSGNLSVGGGGVFAPGSSPGSAVVEGDYAQAADGILAIEIGGTTPGTDYDVLDVSGTATLGGTLTVLDVLFSDGSAYAPLGGEQFDVIRAADFSGEFESVMLFELADGLFWDVQILQDVDMGMDDVLRLSVVSAVPLPAGVWLLVAGLIALFGRAPLTGAGVTERRAAARGLADAAS